MPGVLRDGTIVTMAVTRPPDQVDDGPSGIDACGGPGAQDVSEAAVAIRGPGGRWGARCGAVLGRPGLRGRDGSTNASVLST